MYSALILAAGEGKRMNSSLPKVLHEVCFKSLIKWVLNAAGDAQEKIIVVGNGAEEVKKALGDNLKYIYQAERLGTGHAAAQARDLISGFDDILIIGADTPLITKQTLNKAFEYHKSNCNSVTMLTVRMTDSRGYGMVLRDDSGNIIKIAECDSLSAARESAAEVSSGIYFFDTKALLGALDKITPGNPGGEYNLADTIEIIINENNKTGAFLLDDCSEIYDVNDRAQLAGANEIMRKRIVSRLMGEGVSFISPDTAYIGAEVQIGRDTVIMPNTIIEGETKIGSGCIIGPNSKIVSCRIGQNVEINNSVALSSEIDSDTSIGPFAYIRPNCTVGKHVKIGDFVEVKNSVIGDGTKASHLTYIGDADVGKNINFGCGTIVVNYDGIKKYRSEICDDAFIGCNTNLVSPVKVGKGAFIAAGSTITDDIPDKAFAIARSRQTVKTDWKRKTK